MKFIPMIKCVPVVCGLLWLSGCARPVHDTGTITPAVCCTALEQLPAQDFNGKTSRVLTFDARTPRVTEGNGSARAQVLALPTLSRAYTLELTVPVNGEQFVAVEAVLYDADWKPLKKLAYKDFDYRKPVLLEGHRLFADMVVEPGDKAARWLAIATVAHPQPDRLKLVAESEIYAKKTQVEAPLERARYATAGEDGTIRVRISRISALTNELINAVTGQME